MPEEETEVTDVPNAVAGFTPVTLPIKEGVMVVAAEVTPETVPTRLVPDDVGFPALAPKLPVLCKLCTLYPPDEVR